MDFPGAIRKLASGYLRPAGALVNERDEEAIALAQGIVTWEEHVDAEWLSDDYLHPGRATYVLLNRCRGYEVVRSGLFIFLNG